MHQQSLNKLQHAPVDLKHAVRIAVAVFGATKHFHCSFSPQVLSTEHRSTAETLLKGRPASKFAVFALLLYF